MQALQARQQTDAVMAPAQRRAPVPGDKAGGIHSRGPVARLLQRWQPYQCLGAAHVDAAFFESVLVVQAGRGLGFAQVGDSVAITMSVSACFFCPKECRKPPRHRKIKNSKT